MKHTEGGVQGASNGQARVEVPEENHVSADRGEVAGVQELQELQNKKLESEKAWDRSEWRKFRPVPQGAAELSPGLSPGFQPWESSK